VIDELYHANYAAVLRVCTRILRNPDDAADAAQEVFLIALQSLETRSRRSTARAWLLTVARNHCLDVVRRRKRLGKALVRLAPDAARGTDMEAGVADRDFVGIVFKQLTSRERQALWHSAVESRPLGDIAGRLRLSYMAAAQVLHRARRHAVQVAARVAVVVGVFQLGRQRPVSGSVLFTRLAAIAAVPVILVSVQSANPMRHSAPPTAVPVSAVPTVGSQSRAAAGILGSTGAVAGAPQAAISGVDAVRQLIGPLPAVPAVGKVPLLPSVPALPSPTSVPGLP
jgi:RNA polymerase sigma-70 factor (ECF subfamily)